MKARVAVWVAPNPQAVVHVEEGLDLLRTNLEDVTVIQQTDAASAMAKMHELLPSLDAVLFSPWFRPPVTSTFWQLGEHLKVIAGTFDFRFSPWIEINSLLKSNTVVIDTSRNMTPSVAEFALAMILNLIRDIPRGLNLVRQGSWKDAPWDLAGFVHGDLTGRCVGLAGFGSINRRLAELLAPFHCQVQAYDPYVDEDVFRSHGVQRANSLVDLAQQSEVFVVGLPPTPSTMGIIDASVINALPTGALFVLVTRMQVVEQQALWSRIEAGSMRAAIDVFDPEPPPVTLWARYHPNVMATPHIAGGATYCHRRCFTAACQDALAVLMGKVPMYPAQEWDDQCYQGKLGQAAEAG